MSADDEIKQWFKVQCGANGHVLVTCSLQDGNLSVKWTVKTFQGKTYIKKAVTEARRCARESLKELAESVAELEAA